MRPLQAPREALPVAPEDRKNRTCREGQNLAFVLSAVAGIRYPAGGAGIHARFAPGRWLPKMSRAVAKLPHVGLTTDPKPYRRHRWPVESILWLPPGGGGGGARSSVADFGFLQSSTRGQLRCRVDDHILDTGHHRARVRGLDGHLVAEPFGAVCAEQDLQGTHLAGQVVGREGDAA